MIATNRLASVKHLVNNDTVLLAPGVSSTCNQKDISKTFCILTLVAIQKNSSSQINDQVSEINAPFFWGYMSLKCLHDKLRGWEPFTGGWGRAGGREGTGHPPGEGQATFPRQKLLIDMQSAARRRGWRRAEGANSRLSGCNHAAI